MIARNYTKLNADEALLTGLVSVIGRLYIFLKSQEFGMTDFAQLDSILTDWHPAIAKAIAESWDMSEALVNALETQLDTDPPLGEAASYAEVLSVARLFLQYGTSGESLDANDYPLLQRLGIAAHNECGVTLDEHAEAVEQIRRSLKG